MTKWFAGCDNVKLFELHKKRYTYLSIVVSAFTISLILKYVIFNVKLILKFAISMKFVIHL